MADSGSITFSASVLPEEYRKTYTNETFSYTPADATEGWVVKLVNVTNSGANDLIVAADGIEKSAGTVLTSAKEGSATGDKVKFLFVKHTGTTDGSSTTSDSLYIRFGSDTAAANDGADSLEVPSGMSWFCRPVNCTAAQVHAISGVVNGGGAGGGNVQIVVAALLDDVSA